MTFPASPLFLLLQGAPSDDMVKAAVDETVQLLDGPTLNPEEGRILEIASALTPQEFSAFIRVLASRRRRPGQSYLRVLYEDLNGAEFRGFAQVMKAKLLAEKTGDAEALAETARGVMQGRCVDAISIYRPFMPSRWTTPSSWTSNSCPNTWFDEDGRVKVIWRRRTGAFDVGYESFVMEPTDLAVLSYLHVPGRVDIVTVLEVMHIADDLERARLFDTINIAGMVFGAAAFAAARGAARQAVIAVFQVALPGAGQYVSDKQEQILRLEGGREFLIAWQVFCLGTAAYGLARLLGPAGARILDDLRHWADEIVSRNPLNGISTTARTCIDDLFESLRKLKEKVIDRGGGRAPRGSGAPGGGPPSTVVSSAFHPDIQLPPISGGTALASASNEAPIVRELAKIDPANRGDLMVFKRRSRDEYVLVRATNGDPESIVLGPDRGLFDRRGLIVNIESLSFSFEAELKRFLATFRRLSDTDVEYGLAAKRFADGQIRYAVVRGQAGAVGPPEQGWVFMAHCHHGAPARPGFRYPAPQDVQLLPRAMEKLNPNATEWAEAIYSLDASGRTVKVSYGAVRDPRLRVWVEDANGGRIWFTDVKPTVHPTRAPKTVDELLEEIDTMNVTPDEKFRLKLAIFRDLDPAKYYTGWYARQFTL